MNVQALEQGFNDVKLRHCLITGNCWALAEVGALLSAILFQFVHKLLLLLRIHRMFSG